MEQKFCLDEKGQKEAQAALLLAKRLGLIEDAAFILHQCICNMN